MTCFGMGYMLQWPAVNRGIRSLDLTHVDVISILLLILLIVCSVVVGTVFNCLVWRHVGSWSVDD